MGVIGEVARELAHVARVVVARRSTGVALIVGLVLLAWTALAQLASLSLPIHHAEGHNWREAFSYGVAWNWAHGPIDLLRPRMFVFHESSNVVAMEPPLHPLAVSLLLRVFGEGLFAPRLLSWAGFWVLLVVLWRWLGIAAREASRGGRPEDERGWEERAGLLVALSLAPQVAVEFRQLQPEPLCAGLVMLAAWWASRFARTDSWRHAGIAALAAGLAVLVKPVALGVLPGVVAFGAIGPANDGFRAGLRRALLLGGGLAFALVPWVLWDRWSHHLQQVEMHGAFFIAIDHDPKAMVKNILTLKYAREALLFFVPSYAGATWLVPATVAGMYRALATPGLRRWAVPLLVWLGGYLLELLAVGDRLHSNAYYFVLAPAPVAFFAATGLGAVLRLAAGGRGRPLATVQAGLLVAVLLPASALFVRNWSWSNTSDVAALGLEKNRAMWGDDLGLLRLLFVVLVVFALAPLVRARRLPEPLGLVVVAVLLGSGAWAVRDRAQWFRYYVASDRRAGWDEELAWLREVVDRHARPEDTIVAAPGWSAQSPNMIVFYAALRNGFPLTTGLDPTDVAPFTSRGARLFVRFDPPGEASAAVPGVLLASKGPWRVACLAEDGCPARR